MIDEGMEEGDGGPFNLMARSSAGHTLPEMYDDILDAIYQHLTVLDRVHLQNTFPGRLTSHTAGNWLLQTRKSAFHVSRRMMRIHGGCDDDMDEDRLVYVLQTLLPVLLPLTTDLTINYMNMDEWVRASELMTVLVQTFCRSLVRLHVMNASAHYRRQPERLLVPDMSNVESFVFTEQHIAHNHDTLMSVYLTNCSKNLESLSVHRTTMTGDCLRPLQNLKYLRIRSNLTKKEHRCQDGVQYKQLRALYMSDLGEFLTTSSVRHLDMQQECVTYFDAQVLLSMRKLSHLTLTVHNGNTETLNEFMREILLPDTIEHLALTGGDKAEFVVEHATLEAISRTRRLNFLQLNGVALRSHLWETMLELKAVNGLFQYVLRPFSGHLGGLPEF